MPGATPLALPEGDLAVDEVLLPKTPARKLPVELEREPFPIPPVLIKDVKIASAREG